MNPQDTGAGGVQRVDLRQRATDLAELMDDPGCDPSALDRTYRRFALVNLLVGGWRATFRRHLLPVLRNAAAGGGTVRILDLGCGGGDLARSLARWGARCELPLSVVGIDPDPRAIHAATRVHRPGVEFRSATSRDLVGDGEQFDAVVSNHVLHHLTGLERAAFLADTERLTTRIAVHSDIRRSPAAYRSYQLASPLVAPGTFVRVDGLRSIRRSFTASELREALPAGWRVEAQAPHRVLAIWDAPPVHQR